LKLFLDILSVIFFLTFLFSFLIVFFRIFFFLFGFLAVLECAGLLNRLGPWMLAARAWGTGATRSFDKASFAVSLWLRNVCCLEDETFGRSCLSRLCCSWVFWGFEVCRDKAGGTGIAGRFKEAKGDQSYAGKSKST
jgi:hypothetical protein